MARRETKKPQEKKEIEERIKILESHLWRLDTETKIKSKRIIEKYRLQLKRIAESERTK